MRVLSFIRWELLHPEFVRIASLLTTILWGASVFPVWGGTPTSFVPDPNLAVVDVTITIRSREFRPHTLTIFVGQKTRLVLKNLDTELHAFVPVGLFADSHLTVSGNGAPQFAKEGFVRVLLPTRGQTDLVFTPARQGTYPYFCDLPGHEMRGIIVVHEKPVMLE